MKKIVMFGICGNMGVSISKELIKEEGIELVGGFDIKNAGKDIGEFLTGEKTGYRIYDCRNDIKKLNPDIIIDFTNADVAYESINWAIDNNIDIIVGTTGFSRDELSAIERKSLKAKSKTFIVPNFSIGAVIMIKISKLISKYFDNCEIIEMHHDKKKDAPSGTSLYSVEEISQCKKFNESRLEEGENEIIEGSRGGFKDGIHIHSVRLPGLMAHQNIIFGARGQTLSIRHDSLDRSAFYPGVILAIKNIDKIQNYTFGLDKLIDI
ncbi:MAG: 4-hydroxy-tetrahydrodipicolinate reductase [Candidatus Humimicrobiaceae bacterium]|jgi:4-hydroxy-tetrahydrodipicolinate reductase|nr:4-hydroxy-tetrahydrodipicolinate reductase [Actinomycetota bacterium]MDD5600374.1 4-hydroxy-tetrahydrodipicolinate reductase [Actinomycetota bacterium]MDY0027459.1 4-hydroxy-tetrahydrodipicolinate reductase [Candidatus Humimicrobiaceae bacterium]